MDINTTVILRHTWPALVSIYQADVTSFSQFSIKYKSFENEPDPNPNHICPNPNREPNRNQIIFENLENCVTSFWQMETSENRHTCCVF